jgi:hypothetical protein
MIRNEIDGPAEVGYGTLEMPSDALFKPSIRECAGSVNSIKASSVDYGSEQIYVLPLQLVKLTRQMSGHSAHGKHSRTASAEVRELVGGAGVSVLAVAF